MKNLLTFLLFVIVIVGSGCSTTGTQSPAVNSSDQQQNRFNTMMEQVDSNSASIRENNNTVAEISNRLSVIETTINNALSVQNVVSQETKENITFINDQLLRIDSSLRSNRPSGPQQAASVFRPGGFDPAASYQVALSEYNARRYERAISGFNELLTVSPNSDLADNAQYWIGECYFSMGNYEKALESFSSVFDFPKSNKLADAHYKIGVSYLKIGNQVSAKEELSAVTVNYPGTTAAKKAAEELGKLGE